MKQKIQKQRFSKHSKIALIVVALVAVLALGGYLIVGKIMVARQSLEQASISQIRELIIDSIENLKKDVPVDAKTGDLYFPESRLYVPNPRSNIQLNYDWLEADDSSPETLSVSYEHIPAVTSLYTSSNLTELFDKVPKLQACSRGVKVLKVQAPATSDIGELKETVALQDGSELYLYSETACPEMSAIVEVLTNLRAY